MVIIWDVGPSRTSILFYHRWQVNCQVHLKYHVNNKVWSHAWTIKFGVKRSYSHTSLNAGRSEQLNANIFNTCHTWDICLMCACNKSGMIHIWTLNSESLLTAIYFISNDSDDIPLYFYIDLVFLIVHLQSETFQILTHRLLTKMIVRFLDSESGRVEPI